MPSCRTLRTALLAACLLTPAAARADLGPDDAAKLESQIHDWLAAVLGPGVPIADHPVHVTPEGDHYGLSIAIAGSYGQGITVAADPITAAVKPLDANRWDVQRLTMPSPLRLENTAANDDQLRRMATKFAEQSTTGVLDLSLATTTSFDTTLRDYSSMAETPNSMQTTHVAGYVGHTALQPAGNGRVDVASNGRADTVTLNATLKDGTALAIAAAGFDGSVHAEKVSLEQIGAAIRAISALATLPGTAGAGARTGEGGAAKALSPEERHALRDLVVAAQDLLGGFDEKVAVRDFTVRTPAADVAVRQAALGLGLAAPDGRADLHISIAVDGIDASNVPAGPLQDYMPRQIVLKPHVAGVPTGDLVQFLLSAIDTDGGNSDLLAAEAMGLLAKGPLSIGIDELALAAGPSTLSAAGAVSVSAPADISGAAQIRITAFDTLLQQVSGIPEFQQAAPFLIFLRGIGKADGDAELWDVSYLGRKLVVNGTDLSAMLSSNAKPTPAPGQSPRRR
ncbi:MAG TPA: hypothetical protein VHS58_21230 [Acetobacteraceae bacterium]|nr:hypothetical protein [Acetobacteraceae bacterium]